jgi:hypothetical protein
MRKRNHVESVSRPFSSKSVTDYVFQFHAINELHNSQPAQGNNEAWPQNLDFIVHPGRAVADFIRRRNTVCAAGILSGKATAHRCEINFRSNRGFVHTAEFFEPAEKGLPSSVRERPLQNRFSRSGRLTNDHYIAHDCPAGHRRRFHSRATTAAQQRCHVSIKSCLNNLCSHGPVGVRTWLENAQGHTGHGPSLRPLKYRTKLKTR